MFQVSFVLTLEDSTSDEVLLDILASHKQLFEVLRELHPQVLLASLGCKHGDDRAKQRMRGVLPGLHKGVTEAQRTAARDILRLAAMERGDEVPRFDEGP